MDVRKITTIVSVVAVVLSAGPHAQAKPNFSGKWVLDTAKTAGGVSPITIAMNSTTFKITVPSKDGSGTTTTYKFDAPARRIVMARANDSGGKRTEEVSTATIEGDRVVIRTTGTNGDSVVSWYREGAWLVHERTATAGWVKAFYKEK